MSESIQTRAAIARYQDVFLTVDAQRHGELQAEMMRLLARQTERYTMGDSSSVPVETAAELLRSMQFCIGLRLQAGDSLDRPPAALLEDGIREAWARAEAAKELLALAQETALEFDNLSYRDTLSALPAFFQMYDYRFFAHEIPCMIDYQLCRAVPDELLGVEYIEEYLRRMITENRFCRCFPLHVVAALLHAYCADPRELLINLFEPVFVNAVGRALLGLDPLPLTVAPEDHAALLALFHPWDERRVRARMSRAVAQMCVKLGCDDGQTRGYLHAAADDLLHRIRATDADAIGNLFVSF